ncbi:hypothetical protein [Streptomyces sp. NPDC058145]|uniref:hypothetical protein n=1 Tax=Streptomyces sp. NPDC058145 TaxID=3346356 RepID=UPI0036F05448
MALSRLLESLRSADRLELVRSVAERMLQELIESDAAARIGAEWTEHTEARIAYPAATCPKAASTKSPPASALTKPEFSGDLHAGDASVREALDSVLHRDPPLANFVMTYPTRPVDIGGFLLPADQPVVISHAACNNDPTLGSHRPLGNRAHFTWGAGRTAARPDRTRTSSPKPPSSTSSTLCP